MVAESLIPAGVFFFNIPIFSLRRGEIQCSLAVTISLRVIFYLPAFMNTTSTTMCLDILPIPGWMI